LGRPRVERLAHRPAGGRYFDKEPAFKLPGKKVLQPSDHEIEFIVVDVAETPVERPKKSNSLTTAARRSGIR
jgi:hypothetical protein